MPVPNIFASATSAIPLSQLDQNFATAITLGNTAVYLGNTTTSLGNVTLTNVTISSGNVSVSTATVGAGSNTAPSITTTGDTNTGIFFPAADTIAFTEGGVESARIDASGNMGLGVTPSAWYSGYKAFQFGNLGGGALSQDNTNGFTHLTQNTTYTGNNSPVYQTSGYATRYTQAGGAHYWLNAPSGTAGNTISFTQAMTLDASGNWILGGTTARTRITLQVGEANAPALGTASGGAFFGNSNVTYGTLFGTSGAGYGWIQQQRVDGSATAYDLCLQPSGGRLLVGTNTGQGGNNHNFFSSNGNTTVLIKDESASAAVIALALWNNATSGNNVFTNFYTETFANSRGTIDFNRDAGLVRYNTTSDATLKNIIGDSDGTKSSQILKSTRIREYSWKDDKDNKPQIGVIAQELYETFKGAVSVGGDKVTVDEEGNETTKYVPWAVDKTAFTFHLIAGWQKHEQIIQEQQAIITQLQADVAALKGTA
jgi:hypothetical protein